MSDKCKHGICDGTGMVRNRYGYHSWPCKCKDEEQNKGVEDLNIKIKQLKAENEWLKVIVDHLENNHCDCSDFADYGVHGKNCHVTRLRKEL